MEENVIISIKGSQLYEGQDPDVTELVTAGTLRREQEGYTIAYQETELTGLEGTTTKLRIEGPRVTLLRQGSVNSQMIFEVGRKHLSMYETPYGALAVGIETRRLKNTVDEAGGDLEIDYAIEIDNLLASNPVYQKLDKTTVEDGDWVNIDFVGKKDGEAFDGGSSDEGGYDLLIGSGSFIDGFEDGLIGKQVGDSFELPLTFPETYTPNPDLAGQDVVFEVTVNAIEEQVDAEWNDEFVQANTDYQTVDEYVEATKASLQEQKNSDKAYYVMQAIVDDSEFDCADSDVQSLVDTQKQQYEQYASYFGMSLDDFLSNNGMTDEKLEENARFQISCTLAIDAIGKAENMTVSDEEYQSGLEELANQYGAESGEAFEEQYGKEDVENSILYDKIMDYVVDQAVVK